MSTATLSPPGKRAARGPSRPPPARGRRTRLGIQSVRDAIRELLEAEQPMTVRQVFYRLVSQGVIEKSEPEYKNTVVRLLGRMRRDGEIPFDWIADNTRWMRKPNTFPSMQRMLEITKQTYRRAIWHDQDAYVEVWLEKDALAGVVLDVTAPWDVPLMVTRGYSSLSFLHSAAEQIAAVGKPAFLYYFGDHDPSGIHIPKKTLETLRELAPDADITFEVIAVTPEQIEELDLPTRPTKKSDSRSRKFNGESVEVDAIPPSTLRELVKNCIVRHVDQDVLERTLLVEKEEKRTLATIAAAIAGEDL